MNRPDGNVTGINMITVALAPKRLELLHELVPPAGVIALLVNPTSPYVEPETKDVMTSARALGRQVLLGVQPAPNPIRVHQWGIHLRDESGAGGGAVWQAFATKGRRKAGGWYIPADDLQEALADVYEHALDSAAAEALGGEHTTASLGVLVDRDRVLAQAYEMISAAQSSSATKVGGTRSARSARRVA